MGCADRGKCLRSHVEHRPPSTQMIVTFAGTTPIMIPIHYAASDETVCDRWQRP